MSEKVFYKYDEGTKKFPLERSSKGSSGIDLHSQRSYRIDAGEIVLVSTGLRVSIPYGYEIQVRPRSGLALKHGITVLNTPGTVDSDYRGEVGVILVNHSKKPFYITPGDRIAQMIVSKVCMEESIVFEETKDLEKTERGEGGFGSSGKDTKVKLEEAEKVVKKKRGRPPKKKEN